MNLKITETISTNRLRDVFCFSQNIIFRALNSYFVKSLLSTLSFKKIIDI